MTHPGIRWSIVGLVLLTLITAWLGRRNTLLENLPIAGLDPQLQYALSNFNMRLYDEQGQLAAQLSAPRLASDAATGIGRVTTPSVMLNHEGYTWTIIAESATVSEDHEQVLLTGAVNLERRGPVAEGVLHVQTSEVTLEVTPRVAHSQQLVKVTEPAGWMTAHGFSVDLLANTFELTSNVQGSYALQ